MATVSGNVIRLNRIFDSYIKRLHLMIYIEIMVILALVIFIIWFFFLPARFTNVRFQELESYFDHLSNYGINGTCLLIRSKAGDRYLQVFLNESGEGNKIFSIYVPKVNWSLPFISEIEDLCKNEKLKYDEKVSDNNQVEKFIVIKDLSSPSSAGMVSKRILNAMNLGFGDRFIIKFLNGMKMKK